MLSFSLFFRCFHWVFFFIKISHCNTHIFQMTYTYNAVTGGVHYMCALTQISCEGWVLGVGIHSPQPALVVTRQASPCYGLAQLFKPSQKQHCLSGWNSSAVSEFLAVKPDFLLLPVILFYRLKIFSTYSLVAQPQNVQWCPYCNNVNVWFEILEKNIYILTSIFN